MSGIRHSHENEDITSPLELSWIERKPSKLTVGSFESPWGRHLASCVPTADRRKHPLPATSFA